MVGLRQNSGSEAGQSLIETALLLPFLLLLVFNAVNFGYFFIVGLRLTAPPRQAAEYSIQGFQTPDQPNLPPAGPSSNVLTVSALTYADLTGTLPGWSNVSVQVCAKQLGVDPATKIATCAQYGAAPPSPASWSNYPAVADPEPSFVLNQVDIIYRVNPLIAAEPFGLTLTPSVIFHRHVRMRAMD